MKRIIYVLALPVELFVKLISFSGVGGDSGGGKTDLFENALREYQEHSGFMSAISQDSKASFS